MKYPRSAGILLHITSLPGNYGIGDLGPSAFEFADFLAKSHQTIWQILPVCPPASGHSPYSSYSVFAGNVDLISPDALIAAGWASPADLEIPDSSTATSTQSGRVNFSLAKQVRAPFFRKIFERVQAKLPEYPAFAQFLKSNAYWLDDFSLFEAIGGSQGNFQWHDWPKELAIRVPIGLEDFRVNHPSEILYSQFLQFLFHQQWQALKEYCNGLGIQIYGDLPIFVDHQSADVWANQVQFDLDSSGKPVFVAGVPPDYFSETGQKWGNPLYRWDVMQRNGFRWWKQRFRRSLDQFDIIRVDHFRGFEAYWQIPADAPNAIDGQWIKGPGEKPFRAAEEEFGELPIVAEDLGLITPEVDALRDALDFPAMRVMQFGYGSETNTFHRPDCYPEHCVAYTGTHDNDTIAGWYQSQMTSGEETTRRLLSEAFAETSLPRHLAMIQTVLNSQANTAIIPMQDYLGLGNDARMNLPATVGGNWSWQLQPSDRWQALAPVIRQLTDTTHRYACVPAGAANSGS